MNKMGAKIKIENSLRNVFRGALFKGALSNAHCPIRAAQVERNAKLKTADVLIQNLLNRKLCDPKG